MTTSRIAVFLAALAATGCASKAPESRIVAERWDTLGLITPRVGLDERAAPYLARGVVDVRR